MHVLKILESVWKVSEQFDKFLDCLKLSKQSGKFLNCLDFFGQFNKISDSLESCWTDGKVSE